MRLQGLRADPPATGRWPQRDQHDTQWFGNALPQHPQLTNLKLDVRDTDAIPLDGVDHSSGQHRQ